MGLVLKDAPFRDQNRLETYSLKLTDQKVLLNDVSLSLYIYHVDLILHVQNGEKSVLAYVLTRFYVRLLICCSFNMWLIS